MARMLGKAHRLHGCAYGCCREDFARTGRARRAQNRRARRVEARAWRREATSQ